MMKTRSLLDKCKKSNAKLSLALGFAFTVLLGSVPATAQEEPPEDPGNLFGIGPDGASGSSSGSSVKPSVDQPSVSIDLNTVDNYRQNRFDTASVAPNRVEVPENVIWGDLGEPSITTLDFSGGLDVIVTIRVPPGAIGQNAIDVARGNKQVLLNSVPGNLDVIQDYERLPIMLLSVDQQGLAALQARADLLTGIQTNSLDSTQMDSTTLLIGSDFINDEGHDGSNFSGGVGSWEVVIADNGTRVSHQAFSGRISGEACFVNPASGQSCPNGSASMIGPGAACDGISSDCMHGTHVAGTAAGAFAGLLGGADGVAPGAQIYPIDVFGFGGPGLSFTSDQIAAMEHVLDLVNQGRNIASINFSLGGGLYSGNCDSTDPARVAAAQALRDSGVLVVAAAGNSGSTSQIGRPACLSPYVAVGATSDFDSVASFSDASTELDLWAPGVNVDSAGPASDTAILFGYNGTSMSTPHVAGAAAILRSCSTTVSGGSNASPFGDDAVLSYLLDSSVTVTDGRFGGSISRPRLDVEDAARSFASISDDFPGLNITGAFSETWRTMCSTIEQNEPDHLPTATVVEGASQWYTHTADLAGTYKVTTCNANTGFDTALAAYRGGPTIADLEQIASDDDDSSCGFSGLRSTLQFVADAGEVTYFAVSGFNRTSGVYELDVSYDPVIPTCNGLAADILGTSGIDVITASASGSVIISGGSNDTITGLNGNDTICSGFGNDTVTGGGGNDVILTGNGDDTVSGGNGADFIVGSGGNDDIFGNAGNDTLWGGAGDDDMEGGDGNDRINGNNGTDFMYGGNGRDIMRGFANDDFMYGEAGIDNMFGGGGNDLMEGGAANDTLSGNIGNDTLIGGSQSDRMFGGGGIDSCDGGTGIDSVASACETISNFP